MSIPAPSVSVVIPTYNRASTIVRSVNSVLQQTYPDLEIIVVDDCSQDDTVTILQQIRDPRLRILHHETNRGGSAARNTGIHAARGILVAFQDSDDEWLSNKLEKQLATLQSSDSGTIGVYSGMVVVGSSDVSHCDMTQVRYVPRSRPGALREGWLKTSLLQNFSFISTQTFVVRRDVLVKSGGFDESLKALQDWDCFLRVADYGPIAYVAEPLVVQWFSPDSLTRSALNRVLAMQSIVEKHEKELRTMPKTLAHQYRILAGGYRRVGRRADSRTFYRRSLRFDPFRLGAWLKLCHTSFLVAVELDP